MPAVHDLIATDPIARCFVEARLFGEMDSSTIGAEAIGYLSEGSLRSFILLGANLVPVATTPQSRAAFGDWLRPRFRRCSSFVGPRDEVLDLWRLLEPSWGPSREVRGEQPFLVIDGSPAVVENPLITRATRRDLDLLVPACVQMFTEEVGIPPFRSGGELAYRARVAELVDQGRAFVWIDDGQVRFKAEVGAVGSAACQVQGVWVHPNMRGRGIAAPAIARVVTLAYEFAPAVALYVNDFNHAARKAYRRVGFREHTRFATVLF